MSKTNQKIIFIKEILKKKELIIAFAAFFALIIALLAEEIIGIKPCKLCVIERYVYISLIFSACLSIKFYKNRILKFVLLINLLFLVIFSSYHVLYEKNYIKSSSICDSEIKVENLSREEIVDIILKEKYPSCKTPVYIIKNFSFAELNLYYSCLLLIIFVVRKNEEN